MANIDSLISNHHSVELQHFHTLPSLFRVSRSPTPAHKTVYPTTGPKITTLGCKMCAYPSVWIRSKYRAVYIPATSKENSTGQSGFKNNFTWVVPLPSTHCVLYHILRNSLENCGWLGLFLTYSLLKWQKYFRFLQASRINWVRAGGVAQVVECLPSMMKPCVQFVVLHKPNTGQTPIILALRW